MHGRGDMHGGGHAWWGACVAGKHVFQGACMARGHAWQRGCMVGRGACMADTTRYGQ